MTDRTTQPRPGKDLDSGRSAVFAAGASVFVALPLLAGCGGGGDGGPTEPEVPDDPGQTVASVEVSPDTAAASELGGTVQFEAQAKDGDGNTLSGVSFSWSTTDGSVATVDGQGTATAQANGAAVIEAIASGVTGSAYLAVRSGELEWKRIRAGNIFSCGVTTHGTAYCWGDNVHGELGDGNTTQAQLTPVRVRARLYFDQLTLGGAHICALSYDGTAYCWGNSSFGEGGYGEETGVQTDPVEVSGGHTFRQIAASGNHTCGLATDGATYCWGRNGEGQLGDGTTSDRLTPVAVSGGLTFEQISVAKAAVDNHSCAVTSDGDAYCWGVNRDGELGDGTTEERHEPVQVESDLTFVEIRAGGRHSCALTADGTAYCWGGNPSGQLGDGTTEDRMEPVQVSGGLVFDRITAGGGNHTCGLTADGVAYCWGGNSHGQLGDGTTQGRTTPVQVSGGLTFRHMEAGEDHTCGVTTAGVGYCWGNGGNGRLGTGDRNSSSVPRALPDPGEID